MGLRDILSPVEESNDQERKINENEVDRRDGTCMEIFHSFGDEDWTSICVTGPRVGGRRVPYT